MTALINDAKKAGYTVTRSGDDIAIIKRVGRWKKPRGIYIYGDGTAFDVSVHLGVAKGIRSYRDMRAVLEIGGAK
jgi:hypothetical protein